VARVILLLTKAGRRLTKTSWRLQKVDGRLSIISWGLTEFILQLPQLTIAACQFIFDPAQCDFLSDQLNWGMV
jgi:hypothetical protein